MAKNNIMSVAEFLQWEKYSRDTIDLKRTYVDITGDLVCGVLLSQIMYWHLPDKDGKTKMNVVEEGKYWIRKKREDWWEECRITPKQFDRASAHLCKLGFAESKSFIFSGRYTKHIRLNIEKVIYAISTLNGNGNSPKSSGSDHSSKGKGVFPKGSIIDSSEGKGTDVINPCNNCKSEHENLQTTEKTTNKDIPYSRKKKEKPKSVEKTSVDKPSVQYGTVDSRFSLADSKEKKFSQILKNKKIEIPNIERKDLKKNFVGNPAKFK
ncbi:MAG: hypothetical protein EOM04_09565, partial [Clostridia bacterium]|nr:hypothetical protein [Clostridia bacterium]